MKKIAFCMTVLTASALVGTAWAGRDKDAPQLLLELDLADGSHIIGVPSIGSVPVQTSYAKMDVPLKQILGIRIDDNHETASLDLRNGDKLKGVVNLEPIKLETVFGKVSVGIEHIRNLRVALAGGKLPHGLVLHYSFDLNGGDRVTDGSGKGNDGQLHGGRLVKDGKVGSAYGSSDNRWYINAGAGVAASLTGDYTVSMWVNLTDKTSRHQGFFFLNRHNGERPMYAYFNVGLQRMNWHTHAPDGKQLKAVTIFDVPADIPLNRWAHLIFRHRDTQWEIYLDGKQLISYAGSRDIPQQYNGNFIIGSDQSDYMLCGAVDEVMIFNRSLTDNEMKRIGQIGDTPK